MNDKPMALGARLSAGEDRPSSVSRREALQTFGLAGIAAALDVSLPQLERAVAAVASLAESRKPSAESQQPYAPRFFTRSEWQLVRLLADCVIPRDARSGSATDAKVPEYMDFLLSDREASESSKVSMRGGLAWMNQESRRRFGKSFVAATDAERRRILDDIAYPARAESSLSQGVAFFNRFRDLTAAGFFSSQMGWQDLQYLGNVSLPSWNGCPQPALDKLGVSYDLMTTRVPPSP